MAVTGNSFEQVYYTRIDELRRQAYRDALLRKTARPPLAGLAAGLRALAARLERSRGTVAGPWREDFDPLATWRA